jgi:filamentous hemagglutinin
VLETRKGSVIDIRGGGDLYAYRWIDGAGGTRDILRSTDAFAIVPGYDGIAAPYAPFNAGSSAEALGGAEGYVNSKLRIGDSISLAGGKGFPGGVYTLLPARYALLPGAWLVSPVGGSPASSVKSPDASRVVSGFTFNALDSSRDGPTTITRYELAPGRVVRDRADYVDLHASSFLASAASLRGITPQRLPTDAGRVSYGAESAARIRGLLVSTPAEGGRGALVDLSSSGSILINRTGGGGSAGQLVLSTALLNSFNAESLLIGGSRENGDGEASVEVSATEIIVNTKGSTLRSEDLILAATDRVNVRAGSRITARETNAPPELLSFGTDQIAGSGNSAVLRISGHSGQSIRRLSITNATSPVLEIASGARIKAAQAILDSSSLTELGRNLVIDSRSVTLGSGRISIRLGKPGALAANPGLVLEGKLLDNLVRSSGEIGLRAYSQVDVYGNGRFGNDETSLISISSPFIRSRNHGGETTTFRAEQIFLAAPQDSFAAGGPLPANGGTLRLDAGTIFLGSGKVSLQGTDSVRLTASDAVRFIGDGDLAASGDMTVESALITGASADSYGIRSNGSLRLVNPGNLKPKNPDAGLGASLELSGTNISINTNIVLTSGRFTASATAGDIRIGDVSDAGISVDGGLIQLGALTRQTDAGFIELESLNGDVRIFRDADLSVAANPSGGSAGAISVVATKGLFVLDGKLDGAPSPTERSGVFSLDVSRVPGNSLAPLDTVLNAGGFSAGRDFRVRTGDLTIAGSVRSSSYRVTLDQGDLRVTGNIDASGATGGSIDLKTSGSLTLTAGSVLSAAAREFDAAGKGGSIVLEAGNPIGSTVNSAATLDLRSGSVIDLSVAAAKPSSETRGHFTGTLHLRAPRTNNNADIGIEAIGATIRGASSILVEGTKVYTVAGAAGTITTSLQNTIRNEAQTYLGAAGSASSSHDAMLSRLTTFQPGLDLILAPGVEIINPAGSITLGSATSTASADWNLASWRFGPRSTAGVLTLRASEDLVFFNALSDGFSGGTNLWLSPLTAYNPLLPSNTQSWSFRLAAGADLTSAGFRATVAPDTIAPGTGMLDLGKNAGAATVTGGSNARTASLITNLYQVIRTGSGDIDIHTAGGVRLLNPFASIYTAGTRLRDATSILGTGDFRIPILDRNVQQGNLGAAQQNYPAQYSMAGGNVTIATSGSLERKTRNNSGLIDDSSRQLPNNWLYRRGYLASDGTAGAIRIGSGFTATTDPSASTSWWVDFSNFFQTVGALGGGNVSLSAEGSIRNFDAAIPTNARTASGAPSAAGFVELGGGNLTVTSRNDISGGVYYVERGSGSLSAGGEITTNATRSPSFGLVGNLSNPSASALDADTWLPTTLFAGKSSFTATAAGDLLLGPVSNPFLLPQGIGNRFWYKTYFSTMSPDASVEAVSLGGTTEYRNAITTPTSTQAVPALLAWHQTQLQLTSSPSATAWFQPWLRLAETVVTEFSPVWSLSAPSVSLVSLSSDVNFAGNLTTFPSPRGHLEILASGSINALRPSGLSNQIILGSAIRTWTASVVNLSDSDPAALPGIFTPLSTATESGAGGVVSNVTTTGFMQSLSNQLDESGSFIGLNGTLQNRQARHTPGGLHRDNPEPVRVQALNGDISGLTLFTGKPAVISAGRDISDISFYLQNNRKKDISVVTAGRDIVAFNGNSTLRSAANAAGNSPAKGQSALAGDIQVAGPGTLQVLAGGNIDLGVGANNADGTGTGITSIGNLRNPYLPSTGADLIVGAGIGGAASLSSSPLDIASFIKSNVLTGPGADILDEIAPGTDFGKLSSERQAQLAVEVFYRTLRDTGRDYNDPESPGFRSYDTGLEAIASLFPEAVDWSGSILTQSRDIRTKSGGNISILAPGGGVTMAEASSGNTLAPPGIITESGGDVSIFTNDSVSIGIGRIFTLRGGDIMIWSSKGDIAAGSSSRTVQSAPPTRVVIDPQSASVQTDLAGLATGGGIGVLATVEGVDPGDVDLIAPTGIIDAGDAGIRVSGNINLAAVTVVNSTNISAGGTSTGGAVAVSPPSVTAVTAAANTAAASSSPSTAVAESKRDEKVTTGAGDVASEFSVTVIGYGGGDADEEQEEDGDSPE